MADAEDAHDIVLEEEQDAVVAEAEAESPGHFAMQRRYLVSGKSSGFCPNSASRSSIGNALATVLSKPGLTFTEGAALLLGDWLFLIVNHDFTEMNVREARRSGGAAANPQQIYSCQAQPTLAHSRSFGYGRTTSSSQAIASKRTRSAATCMANPQNLDLYALCATIL